jgi:predicted HTH transcriptional regulator
MDISEILEKPEGKQRDFKEEFPDGKKLARTVISFANQGGGYICFGVKDEPREITGFDES